MNSQNSSSLVQDGISKTKYDRSKKPGIPQVHPPQEAVSGIKKKPRILGALIDIFTKALRQIYRSENYIVLEFDLTNRPIPHPKPAERITIRPITAGDADSFLELWHDQRALKSRRFVQRIEGGYIGTGAWSGGTLIGVNWLAQDKDYESLTGLWVKLAPGSCYALDLQEHENHRNHGIGLTTLAYSMQEAKRRGFKYQYIIVDSRNKRMLAGAKFLMGYKKAGEIRTTCWLGRPISKWKIGSVEGRDKTLILGKQY